MGRLTADFAKAFSRDLKKNAKRRNWNLTELEKVIDLVVENTPETLEELRRRHNMHTLSGNWRGRYECYSSCSESSIHSISRDSDSSATACSWSLSLPSPS